MPSAQNNSYDKVICLRLTYPDPLQKQRSESQREAEDATLLALKMLEGTMGQGMQVTSRSWEGQERDSPLEPPEGTSIDEILPSAQGE